MGSVPGLHSIFHNLFLTQAPIIRMDITLLCDNTVLTDHYYLGEPGLSVHIRDQETEVLFDLGYSDVFLRNALAMGIAPCDADYVVFSHCHLDHTWGLGPLLRHLVTAGGEKSPEFIGHPALFRSVRIDGAEIGMATTEEGLARYGRVLREGAALRDTGLAHRRDRLPRRGAAPVRLRGEDRHRDVGRPP